MKGILVRAIFKQFVELFVECVLLYAELFLSLLRWKMYLVLFDCFVSEMGLMSGRVSKCAKVFVIDLYVTLQCERGSAFKAV